MITKLKNFFLGSFEELRKVVWPNRKEVSSHTLIVIISTVVAMAIIMAVDFFLFRLVRQIF